MNAVHLRFFDRWLKGIDNGQEPDQQVRIFTMGRNEWRDEDVWPPAGTVVTPFYLHSGGQANTLGGDGTSRPRGAAPATSRPTPTSTTPTTRRPACPTSAACPSAITPSTTAGGCGATTCWSTPARR